MIWCFFLLYHIRKKIVKKTEKNLRTSSDGIQFPGFFDIYSNNIISQILEYVKYFFLKCDVMYGIVVVTYVASISFDILDRDWL